MFRKTNLLPVSLLFILTTATVMNIVLNSDDLSRRNRERLDVSNIYMTIACYKPGRLGNQIWQFFSGWAVAKTLGRKFYYNCKRPMMDDIELMTSMFPNMEQEFEIIHPRREKKIKLVKETHSYGDPKILAGIRHQYLKVDINFAQNARYIVNYMNEIREILQFGTNMTEIGEEVIKNLLKVRKINLDNLLCAHIRQTDFAELGWARNYSETLLAIEHVAKMKKPRTLFIMGDDTRFMEKLVSDLVETGTIRKDSFHSTFERSIDMYLTKTLCKTFVMTTERTTFGFWLAFLMGHDQEVYYLKEYRKEVPRFDDKFPLPWHAIKVAGNTSLLLN